MWRGYVMKGKGKRGRKGGNEVGYGNAEREESTYIGEWEVMRRERGFRRREGKKREEGKESTKE